MTILDGKDLSQRIKNELALEVAEVKRNGGKIPHLAAVLVGENPASQVYVRNKVKSCEEVGFKSTLVKKEEGITEAELLQAVHDLNNDPDIDGFIVQLPLPRHINEERITLAIDPKKDVDGFHPVNFGRMALGMACYLPATPFGIVTMLERYGIETSGKHAVIIGRSNIVGTPMGILLSRKGKVGDCTVTITHSRTRDLPGMVRQADIIVAAIGIPHFVTGDMVKEGAVVIDVGINRIDDPTAKKGTRLVGDVDYAAVAPKCSFITPVPGGVGPMTVMSLLMNTMKASKKEIYGG
ncbi:MAG: bifunctional 5,10-methylene-tetrahydrofolate dehydrogenase/5,10-methylene-tetrahydrofolate cyclohydrolase [Lewinellaceae bacterium]|nr:bifunctional 5,10-methylene-tetrahydrofolate dehydrogenase/5,10-methylene-tetrahydrofolate cyclohydrolase [Saprospiraceae bacterium]MCB9341657.1 bifunctional 5,10-methylene-tetrahydrofolate dehydrogenase/5,10-methylene-tetrahydrofolate cyclohydrolase [Lewinellaceae bacterium]